MNRGIRQNTPLALKMAVVMLMVVITAWFAAHRIETGVMKDFLFEYHLENLRYDAQGELLRFIRYLRTRRNSVRSLVLQKNFDDYIKTVNSKTEHNTASGIILHNDLLPSWFPPPSLTRAHLRYAYALLVDPGGSVLEVYNGTNETIPESLRNPDELLPRLQSTESVLTYIEGKPYLLVVQHFPYPGSSRPGTLMFAFRINSDFLKASQGAIFDSHIVALVDTGEQVLVSSEPDLIQSGESLAALEAGYTEMLPYMARRLNSRIIRKSLTGGSGSRHPALRRASSSLFSMISQRAKKWSGRSRRHSGKRRCCSRKSITG